MTIKYRFSRLLRPRNYLAHKGLMPDFLFNSNSSLMNMILWIVVFTEILLNDTKNTFSVGNQKCIPFHMDGHK